MRQLIGLAAALALATGAAAQAPPRGWRVDRVVVLMRHGVRPPTKAVAMPAGTAADPWPAWPVKPGYLTPHGASAIGLVAGYDRGRFVAASLLPPAGCPAAHRIRVIADSDQRTIATATAYAAALAPGCTLAIEHKPQDVPDPLFSPIDEGAAPIDPAQADAAVRTAAGPAGLAGLDLEAKPILARLDAILCGGATASCGIAAAPSSLVAATPASRPKLKGALDRGSTAAQILLLEYADGKPMTEVGWGRASAADIGHASALHALEFRLLARPDYLARRNMAGLASLIAAALQNDMSGAPAIVAISGHDTNVASLAGLLGLHWSVPGFAADDPSPGGAILLERLTDELGHHRVRVRYRSQTLDQIRDLTPLDRAAPYDAAPQEANCTPGGMTGCPLEQVVAQLMPIR